MRFLSSGRVGGGSAFVLAGMVAAWVASGGHSMSLDALSAFPFSARLYPASLNHTGENVAGLRVGPLEHQG